MEILGETVIFSQKKYKEGPDRRSILQKMRAGYHEKGPLPLELFFIFVRAPGKPSPDQEYKKERSCDDNEGHGNTRYKVYQGQFPD